MYSNLGTEANTYEVVESADFVRDSYGSGIANWLCRGTCAVSTNLILSFVGLDAPPLSCAAIRTFRRSLKSSHSEALNYCLSAVNINII